jgi:hypothetical protein
MMQPRQPEFKGKTSICSGICFTECYHLNTIYICKISTLMAVKATVFIATMAVEAKLRPN